MNHEMYQKFQHASNGLLTARSYLMSLGTALELHHGEACIEIEVMQNSLDSIYLQLQKLQVKEIEKGNNETV